MGIPCCVSVTCIFILKFSNRSFSSFCNLSTIFLLLTHCQTVSFLFSSHKIHNDFILRPHHGARKHANQAVRSAWKRKARVKASKSWIIGWSLSSKISTALKGIFSLLITGSILAIWERLRTRIAIVSPFFDLVSFIVLIILIISSASVSYTHLRAHET